jgi:hypothetical protein
MAARLKKAMRKCWILGVEVAIEATSYLSQVPVSAGSIPAVGNFCADETLAGSPRIDN